MDLGIRGKVALVTGGSRGIGRAISRELARNGCAVCVVARKQGAIDEAVELIRSEGGTAIGLSADLSRLESYDEVVARTREAFGDPDIAVFNMETPAPGPFEDLTEADFSYAYHIVVLCYMRMVKAVLPAMRRQRWGRIVTVGSGAAKQPIRGSMNFAYALANTTRLAAVGLTKTIAAEVAPDGVTLNTIATGTIDTELSREWFAARAAEQGVDTQEFMGRICRMIPVGRSGRPEEMAGLCAYLCSDIAAYTTGETILCDGGMFNSVV
jgi:3-oxoacyl-[acyl-carrier protein] reductase